jgi:hypothetical protein
LPKTFLYPILNDRDNFHAQSTPSFAHQARDSINVDDRVPVLVAGEVEMMHTNFTEVTRMVFVKVGSENWRFSYDGAQKRHVVRTDDDVDHQQDYDLLEVCGACLHVRDQPIRGTMLASFREPRWHFFSVEDSLHQFTGEISLYRHPKEFQLNPSS